ncbi:MAG: hypothetical protein CMM61_10155 [Rhodospirillaceae bacterium]|nr:hypothetical protein [Rhodospirillaceae bacterium]
MNLVQLETFRWVVHYGSFTKAANKLHSTQSTVSMRIAELEADLGVQLLDRSQRKVRVTPKGRDLLRYAAEIHLLTTELKATVGDPETLTGSFRMGIAELIALTWLPDLVAALNKLYPRIEISLEVGLTGNMHDMLRSGEMDLCILPVGGMDLPGLNAVAIGDVDFAFMAAPSLNPAHGVLHPRQLEEWPIITIGPNSYLARAQDAWFRQNKVQAKRINFSNSMEISAGLVRSGLGVSLLPRKFYTDDLENGRMQALDMDPPLAPFTFSVISAEDNVSPLIRKVTEISREVGDFIA